MRRSTPVLVAVAILGLLAGFAIAGRPTEVDNTIINAPVSTGDVNASATTPAETAVDDATTVAAPAFDKAEVRVVIANATTRELVARATADKLIVAGFTDTHPVNSLRSLSESVVYTRPGFEQAAAAIAKQLGLDPAVVQPLTTGPVTGADDRGDVIVVLGKDFVG